MMREWSDDNRAPGIGTKLLSASVVLFCVWMWMWTRGSVPVKQTRVAEGGPCVLAAKPSIVQADGVVYQCMDSLR